MATSKDEKSPLVPILAGLVALSVALAVGVIFWADDDEDSKDGAELPVSAPVSDPESPPTLANSGSSTDGRESGGEVRHSDGERGAPSDEPAAPDFSDLVAGQGVGEVDSAVRDELRAIADSSGSQSQKVEKFKSYLRSRSDIASQMLAVRHLSKLVKDDQYNEFLADELLDPEQSEAVRAALVRDINARNRQVMIPVMAEIATLPEHPLKDYAHQTLGRYLGDGYSSDPERLRGAVNEYMRRSNDNL